MNHFLWIFLLGLVTTAGCHKADNDNKPANHELTGQWRTTFIYDGGFAGTSHVIPPDSLYILSLNKDSTYDYKWNGRLMGSGTFHVFPFVPNGQSKDTLGLVFSDRPYYAWSIHLDNDKLILSLPQVEAVPSSTFSRLR